MSIFESKINLGLQSSVGIRHVVFFWILRSEVTSNKYPENGLEDHRACNYVL